MGSMSPIALTFLRVAGITTIAIFLFPALALAGLTGFDLVTCNEWQRAFGWAPFQIIFISWADLTQAILLWTALALALIAGFCSAHSKHKLVTVVVVSFASLPITFGGGLLLAWATGTSDHCALGF
jgi:hypothetical protein